MLRGGIECVGAHAGVRWKEKGFGIKFAFSTKHFLQDMDPTFPSGPHPTNIFPAQHQREFVFLISSTSRRNKSRGKKSSDPIPSEGRSQWKWCMSGIGFSRESFMHHIQSPTAFCLWTNNAIKFYLRNNSLVVWVDGLQSAGWIRLAAAQQALSVMIFPGIDSWGSIGRPPGTARVRSNPDVVDVTSRVCVRANKLSIERGKWEWERERKNRIY